MEKCKTKILIIQDHDPLDGVSLSVATFGVASKLVSLGFIVDFVSPRTTQNKIQQGVNVIKLESIMALKSEISGADVIIIVMNLSAFFKPLGLMSIDLCEQLSKPCIPWVHTNITNSMFNAIAGVDDFSQKVSIEMLKNTLNKGICKKIVCVSKSAGCSLKTIGVDDNKCVVVFNGIDLQKISDSIIDKKTVDIIFVGKFEPVKGVPFFLAAMKLVKEKFPKVKILMIGGCRDDEIVRSLIKVFNLETNVEVVPKLVNGKLLGSIASAKVLVSSSLSESFGLSIVEAMLLNTLVVVPNIEGPAEVINNGECGFIYNSGDTGDAAEKVLEALNLNNKKSCLLKRKATIFAKDNFDLNKKTKEFVGLFPTQ